jgi:hypothetical protein
MKSEEEWPKARTAAAAEEGGLITRSDPQPATVRIKHRISSKSYFF